MARVPVRLRSALGAAVFVLATFAATPAQASTDTVYQWTWHGPYGNEAACVIDRDAYNEPQWGQWTYGCTYYPANALYSGSGAGWYYRMKTSLD